MNPVLKRLFKIAGENRRLAYGILFILILLILIGFKAAYKFHRAAQDEIEVKKESLLIMASSQDSNKVGSNANLNEKLHEFEKGLIEAHKPSIAAAVLQRSFKSLALKNNVTVASERPLKELDAGAYLLIPVEFQLKTGLPGLKGLLYDLRSSSPMTGINSIAIKVSEGGFLDVTLIVEGVIRN